MLPPMNSFVGQPLTRPTFYLLPRMCGTLQNCTKTAQYCPRRLWSKKFWPRYHLSERRATHLLDVFRFAESDGYREDVFRSTAHHYRDDVIRDLNQDKPYNQFVRKQLAKDEIAPQDFDLMVAMWFINGMSARNGNWSSMKWSMWQVRFPWEWDVPVPRS